MQQRRSVSGKQAAVVLLSIVLLMLIQQVCAAPAVPQLPSVSDRQGAGSTGPHAGRTPRRVARMTPLWRIMNSKPFGAYCQNNYECSTGHCREGQCSSSLTSKPANY